MIRTRGFLSSAEPSAKNDTVLYKIYYIWYVIMYVYIYFLYPRSEKRKTENVNNVKTQKYKILRIEDTRYRYRYQYQHFKHITRTVSTYGMYHIDYVRDHRKLHCRILGLMLGLPTPRHSSSYPVSSPLAWIERDALSKYSVSNVCGGDGCLHRGQTECLSHHGMTQSQQNT